MPQPTLALIHTTPVNLPSFRNLAAEHLAGIRVINILDDSLLADVMAAGGVTDLVRQRLRAYVEQAQVAGAQAVMSCCSSIGEAVEELAAQSDVPVLRIDAPMAEEAVRLVTPGGTIGVLATVRTTLDPTANLIRRTAAREGKAARVDAVLVEGAYEALRAGDGDEHDRRVGAALRELLARADVIVLAQASMARLLAALPEPPRVPVLTSPVSGLQAAGACLLG
ncbi:MAG TPA: aspartate/glutamate racemase family protein [Chloroflexota bacterium]|nr:aspartate/glutamate racemase family protein [Chloroflexota bacterium]